MKCLKSMILGLSVLLLMGSIARPGSTQETKRIHFAVSTPVHYLPIWVAKETGRYSKHGLEVEVIWIRSGAMATLGIVSGQLPLAGEAHQGRMVRKAAKLERMTGRSTVQHRSAFSARSKSLP
jgi:ABC-type nitrate/sulfonate/bicarbonate transport system substrate-binding protein